MKTIMRFAFVLLVLAAAATAAPTSTEGAGASVAEQNSRSLLDFIRAGGPVGYVIMLLSVAMVALVIDTFMRMRSDRLIPPPLVEQLEQAARHGRFKEVLAAARSSPSLLGRIVAGGLARGEQGLPAIREGLQEFGTRETTRLNQQIGYLGLAATIAPMLGLLGTVIGMTRSFNVLGVAKGAARPDELAVGIAEALVTTVMGLAVALPMAVIHSYLRDRMTRVGQDTAAICERLLRSLSIAFETRQMARSAAGDPMRLGTAASEPQPVS